VTSAPALPVPKAVKPLRPSAIFLSAIAILTLWDSLFPAALPVAVAVCLLVGYFAWEWRRLMLNARVLLAACVVLAGVAVLRADALSLLLAAARRMIYLPSFIAVLGLLRAAASASGVTAAAGRHLINQPPSRRYIALTFGSHLFGILFNIGGLALLLDMVRKANTLAAAGGDPRIVAWRERRMTTAIQRGFAAIVFWSPLGVALNLLLASIPGLVWIDIAPIGVACAAGFMALGWIFDRFQRPPGLRPTDRAREPHGARAVALVVGHVGLVSLLTGTTEYVLGWPFQIVLLVVVPIYALAWVLVAELARRGATPLRAGLLTLVEEGVKDFPNYANEAAVFAASGFLGVVLVALVPREILQGLFAMPLPPGLVAGLLSLTVVAFAFAGINGMITVAILASAVSAIDIPGLSKVALALALAGGWAPTVIAAPMTSSLVMTASIVGRRPAQIAFGWNGAFAATALALTLVLQALLVRG
jgi:hypothetical protein